MTVKAILRFCEDRGLCGCHCLGYYSIFKRQQQFYGGDRLSQRVENTIRNISRLGKDGMKEPDRGDYPDDGMLGNICV